MELSVRRCVYTVGIELLRGLVMPTSASVLFSWIICDAYGIADEELYGVALNGAYRMFCEIVLCYCV